MLKKSCGLQKNTFPFQNLHAEKIKSLLIDHSTVVCLVAWPLNESVVMETSLLFLCKFLVISIRIASLT